MTTQPDPKTPPTGNWKPDTAPSSPTLDTANFPVHVPRLPPFLVWPVARREFYLSICLALLPTLVWGGVIFGWRAAAGTIALTFGAISVHLVLRRFTLRGGHMLLAHTAGSALLIACLAQPIWPAWIMLLAGVFLALLIFAWGGPGKERFVSAPVIALLLLFSVPLMLNYPAPQPDAPLHADRILARDRLFMGDLRDTPTPRPSNDPFNPAAPRASARWERSRQASGDDALPMFRPALVANSLLNALSAAAADPAQRNLAATLKQDNPLSDQIIDGLDNRLPALGFVAAGIAPGSIGTVSAFALALGGLFLAYRNILRPRSTFFFLILFILALLLFALTPSAVSRLGITGVLHTWRLLPGYLLTLLAYSFFGSDVLFAAIVLLAWPGIEPVTSRGRRVFLILAAVSAAALHRFSPIPLPAATLTLTLLHPLAPLLDTFFKRRSWLNR